MKKIILVLLLFLFNVSGVSAATPVYKKTVEGTFEDAILEVRSALEQQHFFIVKELNIGNSLKRFSEDWGADYNKNKLEGIYSFVFCHGWYANLIGNADPDLLALCPLNVTLTHKLGVSTIVFVKPSAIARDSHALPVAKKIEALLVQAMEDL